MGVATAQKAHLLRGAEERRLREFFVGLFAMSPAPGLRGGDHGSGLGAGRVRVERQGGQEAGLRVLRVTNEQLLVTNELGGEEAGRAAGVGSDHELLQKGVPEPQGDAGALAHAPHPGPLIGEWAFLAVDGVLK